MKIYYNEFNKQKCAALYALMQDGHIRKGDIDDRPIQDVQPDDVRGYDVCHFFAGIGLWDYALQIAGYDQPCWTGSCPCQPFSSAGRQRGKADDRHLWPEWLRLIGQCRPSTLFGEQVASAIAHGWLDDVYQGLEAEGYAVGAAVLPACSVGAPHRRDRLWFVGNAEYNGSPAGPIERSDGEAVRHNQKRAQCPLECSGTGGSSNVANAPRTGSHRHGGFEQKPIQKGRERAQRHPWQSGVWIDYPDGKQRLIEPRIPLLAYGYPERVGIIHAAGDGIVPQVAAQFIQAFKGE